VIQGDLSEKNFISSWGKEGVFCLARVECWAFLELGALFFH